MALFVLKPMRKRLRASDDDRRGAAAPVAGVKIAIVGAGSIGGYLGALLAAAGDDVTFIARGANLDAISKQRHESRDARTAAKSSRRSVRVFSKMSEAGPQDAVLLTVKAHQVAAVAGDLHHLCDANTSIVTMQNGIPWWYFQRHGGRYDGHAGRRRGSRRVDRARGRPGTDHRHRGVSRRGARSAGRRAAWSKASASRSVSSTARRRRASRRSPRGSSPRDSRRRSRTTSAPKSG